VTTFDALGIDAFGMEVGYRPLSPLLRESLGNRPRLGDLLAGVAVAEG